MTVCERLICQIMTRQHIEILKDIELSLERLEKCAVGLGDLDEYTKKQVEGVRERFVETVKDVRRVSGAELE